MTRRHAEQLAAEFGQAVAAAEWETALLRAGELETALPGNPGIIYNKALVLRELGRPDERIACLERALRLDPSHANARFELASALMDRGDLETAAGLFFEYAKAVPDDADASLNLGNCLLRLGRYVEALPHLEKAHEVAPSDETVASLATALRDSVDLEACESLLAELPMTQEAAALRLKILTQGAHGRFGLSIDQPRLARKDLR